MNNRVAIVIIIVSLFKVARAQQGEISISAGPLLSFPVNSTSIFFQQTKGAGIEAIGQYNISNKSSVLVQTGLASYGIKSRNRIDTGAKHHRTIYSLKGGFKYQFSTSGFFVNALAGIDKYSDYDFSTGSYGLGFGKRFAVKEYYFIDAGVDYITGIAGDRLNIKAVFSLLRKPKNKAS